MKRSVLLPITFLAALSLQVVAETTQCRQSFDLGIHDANTMHESWPWLLAGIATVYLSVRTVEMIGNMRVSSQSYDLVLPLIGAGIVLGIPFVPALFILPSRASVSVTREEVDLDCYRTGYVRRARSKNGLSLLLGETVGIAGILMLVALVPWGD